MQLPLFHRRGIEPVNPSLWPWKERNKRTDENICGVLSCTTTQCGSPVVVDIGLHSLLPHLDINYATGSTITGNDIHGRSDGGYIGIYTLPKSVPENYFVH